MGGEVGVPSAKVLLSQIVTLSIMRNLPFDGRHEFPPGNSLGKDCSCELG